MPSRRRARASPRARRGLERPARDAIRRDPGRAARRSGAARGRPGAAVGDRLRPRALRQPQRRARAGRALGTSYVFAPSYLTLQDDWGENRDRRRQHHRARRHGDPVAPGDPARRERRHAGAARQVLVVGAPPRQQARAAGRGRRPAGPLLVGACHLDSNASPRQRAQQLAALLDRMPGGAAARSSAATSTRRRTICRRRWRACAIFVRKLFTRGLRRAVDGYMRPAASGEQPLFELLAARGFTVDGFNDAARRPTATTSTIPTRCKRCGARAARRWSR